MSVKNSHSPSPIALIPEAILSELVSKQRDSSVGRDGLPAVCSYLGCSGDCCCSLIELFTHILTSGRTDDRQTWRMLGALVSCVCKIRKVTQERAKWAFPASRAGPASNNRGTELAGDKNQSRTGSRDLEESVSIQYRKLCPLSFHRACPPAKWSQSQSAISWRDVLQPVHCLPREKQEQDHLKLITG